MFTIDLPQQIETRLLILAMSRLEIECLALRGARIRLWSILVVS